MDRLHQAAREAKSLKPQKMKIKHLQNLVNQHKGDLWDCNVCGQKILAEEYVKHNFQCQLKDKLARATNH